MELLDRYLQAVKKHLPWHRQDDILAELRANLESQLEDKEAELGRPLTPAEAEAWLRQLGSPVQVAARFQPQQYLIGPPIFPLYLYVLRLASMWTVVIYMIVSAVALVMGPGTVASVAEAALHLPFVLIQVAAWVTAIFAAVEFAATRCPEKCPPIAGFYAKWSPSSLPPLEPALAPGKKRRSYAQAVAEVIFGFLALAWLLLVPRFPFSMFGPGAAFVHASPFRIAPVWFTFYWWCVAINVVQLIWRCIDLLSGSWRRPGRAQHIAVAAVGLIPLVWLTSLRDHAYVLLRHPATDQLRYGPTADSINHGIHVSLQILCVLVVLQLAWEITRLFLGIWRARSAAR